jgi:hypothetical protein
VNPARAALRIGGNWARTVYQPIYETASGMDGEGAGMFYVLRRCLEEGHHRAPQTLVWDSLRSDMPTARTSLGGKTYFLYGNEKHTADTHRPCN